MYFPISNQIAHFNFFSRYYYYMKSIQINYFSRYYSIDRINSIFWSSRFKYAKCFPIKIEHHNSYAKYRQNENILLTYLYLIFVYRVFVASMCMLIPLCWPFLFSSHHSLSFSIYFNLFIFPLICYLSCLLFFFQFLV